MWTRFHFVLTSHGDLGLRLDRGELVSGRAHVRAVRSVIDGAARERRIDYIAIIHLIVITEHVNVLSGVRQNQCMKYLGEIILSD